MKRSTFFAIAGLTMLPALLAQTPAALRTRVRPQIPEADRSASDKVFLEHADLLTKNEEDSFMVLVGNVMFTKGGMTMLCDSAHYVAETGSMDAFRNVRMEQGDTLEVTADELNYDGISQLAVLYADPGREVRLVNGDVCLTTDIFYYNLAIDIGYYETGGTLTDPSNTLKSIKGEYSPSTKEASFYSMVHLNSRNATDTLDIYSDTLLYSTATHVAELYSPSTIVNARGTIYTRYGVYDTDSNVTVLFDRSIVVTPQGHTLTADSIFYDRARGFGEAFGNMELTDTAQHTQISGDYGYYDELADSSFVTGHAMLTEFSGPDTLYLHSRYIQTWRNIDTVHVEADTVAGTAAFLRMDTTYTAVAYPRVRFFRRDMQGICDSMQFTQEDTMLRMFVNPVVWSEDRQRFGELIEIKLNDSTMERATLPRNGFAAQHIEGDHYNQLSGKEMVAFFEDGQMRRLDINGNVEIILYPEEADSTINKIVNAESSFLQAWFKGQTTERVKMWPATTGTATPLFLAKPSIYFLPKFKWFDGIRPVDRYDIFVIPERMEQLMQNRPVRDIRYAPRSMDALLRLMLPRDEIQVEPDSENDSENPTLDETDSAAVSFN